MRCRHHPAFVQRVSKGHPCGGVSPHEDLGYAGDGGPSGAGAGRNKVTLASAFDGVLVDENQTRYRRR